MKEIRNVDDYILGFPAEVAVKLEHLRSVIKKAAPGAEEVISYGMPAYKKDGALVYFAGCKNHIGFYPTGSGVEAFSSDLEKYKCTKGSIHLPLDKAIPAGLISKIVKFRLMENREKALAKAAKKKK